MVKHGLLAYVGQGARGAMQHRRGAGAGLLAGLEVSNCIQPLATEETERSCVVTAETGNFGLKPITHNNLEKQTVTGEVWRLLQSTRLLTGNQEQEPAGPVQNRSDGLPVGGCVSGRPRN